MVRKTYIKRSLIANGAHHSILTYKFIILFCKCYDAVLVKLMKTTLAFVRCCVNRVLRTKLTSFLFLSSEVSLNIFFHPKFPLLKLAFILVGNFRGIESFGTIRAKRSSNNALNYFVKFMIHFE